MPWGAVAAAAVGAVGSYASAKKASKGSQATNEPWVEQQPYLERGFGYAEDAYKSAAEKGAYTGPRVADLNPYQTQGAELVGGYANTLGSQGANSLGLAGLSMLNSGQNYGLNANSVFNRASQDPTQQILSNAALYASNPYADQMIDAANRDTQRMLTEQQMPSLARGLAGSGNTNSTRGGVESAILQRGAADRMNDTAAGIRSSLFNTGLQQSQNQYNQNLQNMLQANAGLLDGFNSGSNSILSGQQAAGNNFDQLTAAGGLYQTQNQNQINANMAQFAEQRDFPMDLAAKYMGTINGGFGGTTTTSGSGSPVGSALMGGLGAGLAGYGVMGKLGGYGSNAGSSTPYTVGAGGYGANADYSFGSAGSNTGLKYTGSF